MATAVRGFPSSFRLKNRRDFVRLNRGRLFSTNSIVIQWGKSSLRHARIGITVVRRFGSAVERNTFRRRAREAFRQSSFRDLPGIDINLKPKNTLAVPFSEFCAALKSFEAHIASLSIS